MTVTRASSVGSDLSPPQGTAELTWLPALQLASYYSDRLHFCHSVCDARRARIGTGLLCSSYWVRSHSGLCYRNVTCWILDLHTHSGTTCFSKNNSSKSNTTWLFSLLKMATMVHINHVSGDFKCKYRLNFSFKNHFFVNPFLTPPKSRKCAKIFRTRIYLLFLMYLEDESIEK